MKPELAATTKLLKSVTSLRFANRRALEIAAPDVTWLAKSKLTPNDRKQLVSILAGFDPSITMARALSTPPEALFTGSLHAFAEVPVEWWDVFDQDNVVQFQLWLYYAHSGLLLKAATTLAVAQVKHSSFAGDERGLDETTAERLEATLRKAKKIAANLYPRSALATVDF